MNIVDKLMHQVASDRNILELLPWNGCRSLLMDTWIRAWCSCDTNCYGNVCGHVTLTPVAERLQVVQSMLVFTTQILPFYIMSNIKPRCLLKKISNKSIKYITETMHIGCSTSQVHVTGFSWTNKGSLCLGFH